MKTFKLQSNETGYDVIGDYVDRYMEHTGEDEVIFSIATSSDGIEYDLRNEFVYKDEIGGLVWLSDWWEGEENVQLFGIKGINEVSVKGGIYEI